MENAIGFISIIISGLRILSFLVGFGMLFHKDTKKQGLNILIVSVIIFIIGFSTCIFVVRWN